MARLVILKLGGSVITHKRSDKPAFASNVVERLAEELARWYKAERPHLILLHGAGSFGHPLARRYRLEGRMLDAGALKDADRTSASVQALSERLSVVLARAGVPAVPLRTSALARKVHGSVVLDDYGHIGTILANGGVPMLAGDVVIEDGVRIAIASADALVAPLAKHFRSDRILLATDVDGVYRHYPPRRDERPLARVDRGTLRALAVPAKSHEHDVTGAMTGKLAALLPLRGRRVCIFNALRTGYLSDALRGKSMGTLITL